MNIYLKNNSSITNFNFNKNDIRPILKNSFLKNLNLVEFIRWLGGAAQGLIKPLKSCQTTFKIQKLLNSIFREKSCTIYDTGMLFTQPGDFKKRIIPEFEVKKTDDLHACRMPGEEGVFQTRQVAKLLRTQKKITLTTKEEVDALLPLIDIPFIPWRCANDGCCMRADIAAQILIHSFVNPKQIFKQYVFGKFNYQGNKWDYHVAVGIELLNGEVRILDPSLNRTSSLSLEEWIGYFKPNYKPSLLVAGENHSYPSLKRVTLIRAEIDEHQKKDCFNGRINIVPITQWYRELYLVHQAKYKMRELIQTYPAIGECFSHLLPVTEEELGLELQARHSYRTQKKLENFKPHSSLLLTAEDISAFSPQWHTVEEVEKIKELLIDYRTHLVSLPLKEKAKQKLLTAIDSALIL